MSLLPSPPQKKNLLLLGAGELGTAILTSLSTLPNHHITLAIRSPQKYTSLTTTYPSLSLLALDLSAPSSALIPLFATYDIIVSATGYGQAPDTLLKICGEVLEAGKMRSAEGKEKLWFFPWQFGLDYDVPSLHINMPLFATQKRVRDTLRADAEGCGVCWTAVSTGIFMSFLFEGFWGVVDTSRTADTGGVTVRALRDWEHKVTVTHVDDIGRVVARIVAGDVDASDKVVYVAGQTVSYAELADVVAKVTGKEVTREEWTVEYLEMELRKGSEDELLKRYRLVFAGEAGMWWDEEGTVNKKLGMEMLGVEEYARRALVLEK